MPAKKTSSKVLTAAKKLRYRPNAIARSLSTRRANIVGIVMADITNPFYPNLLDRLTQACKPPGDARCCSM
jgi:DNA-binding LacI/PurR family transcriptional regulator